MSITLTKASFCILILTIVFISRTEGSCWRYGHSCWGGHGKRSGGGSRVPVVEMQKISEHNSGPSDGLAAQFQELPNLEQQQADISGMDSSSRETPGRNSLAFNRGHRNGELEDEISVGERTEEKEEGVPRHEISDYDRLNDASFLPVARSRKAGIDAEAALSLERPESYEDVRNSLESEEGFQRGAGDFSRRRNPNNKLFLYKLVRVLRKK